MEKGKYMYGERQIERLKKINVLVKSEICGKGNDGCIEKVRVR